MVFSLASPILFLSPGSLPSHISASMVLSGQAPKLEGCSACGASHSASRAQSFRHDGRWPIVRLEAARPCDDEIQGELAFFTASNDLEARASAMWGAPLVAWLLQTPLAAGRYSLCVGTTIAPALPRRLELRRCSVQADCGGGRMLRSLESAFRRKAAARLCEGRLGTGTSLPPEAAADKFFPVSCSATTATLLFRHCTCRKAAIGKHQLGIDRLGD